MKMVAPSDRLDRQIVQALDGVGGVVELHHILIGADLDVAGGNDLVLVGEGVLHVGGREAVRLHRLGIEIDLDLSRLAAIRRRERRRRAPRPGAGAAKFWAQVEHLLFRQGLGGQRQLQHRHGRGVVVEDQRRLWCPAASGG